MNQIYNSNMKVVYDFMGKTAVQVLESYTSLKGWRTCHVDKIKQNLDLNKASAYFKTTET